MDNLQLDPNILLAVADIISAYTQKQRETMRTYLTKITSLIPEWNDDETLGTLIQEINLMLRQVNDKMDAIESTYPSYFRMRAEQISSRPSFGTSSSITGESYSGRSSNSSVASQVSNDVVIMSKAPLDAKSLDKEMCSFDKLGYNMDGYVRVSSNGTRIRNLENVGDFKSPINGQKIVCKSIAWRSSNSVEEANSYNVCGADFYYENGTYCGTYHGKDWQEIYKLNYADTKKYR